MIQLILLTVSPLSWTGSNWAHYLSVSSVHSGKCSICREANFAKEAQRRTQMILKGFLLNVHGKSMVSGHQVKLRISKWKLSNKRVELFDHIINSDDVAVVLKSLLEIRDATAPFNQISLRSFLRLAGYYQKFNKMVAMISALLYAATYRTTSFYWNNRVLKTFDALKTKLTSSTCTGIPRLWAAVFRWDWRIIGSGWRWAALKEERL